MSKILDLADRSWPLLRRLMGGHATVYRASGGLIGHRVPGAPPTLLLEHVGAKSGQKRISPLTYTSDGDQLVLVASKGGYPKNPAWFHNLKANPDTVVRWAARSAPCTPAWRTPRSASGSGPRSWTRTPATPSTRSAPTARSRS